MKYPKTKNSDLRRSVSRCNRSVDQPGLEICWPKGDPLTVGKKPGTSRL